VDFTVKGQTTPVLEVILPPGETIVAEAGELGWMAGDVQLHTATNVGASQGGFMGAAKRAVGGGTFFMTRYTAGAGQGCVVFPAKAPGEIREVLLDGHEFAVHRGGFLCGEENVELGVYLQKKLGVGIFGGAGFLLQKITGFGRAYVELHGDVTEYQLGPTDELRVHPGHIGLFQTTVQLELTSVPGIRNKLFGGDLFLARLRGPGHVWLQSISLAALAHALEPYLDVENGRSAAEVGGGAAVLGSLLKNR